MVSDAIVRDLERFQLLEEHGGLGEVSTIASLCLRREEPPRHDVEWGFDCDLLDLVDGCKLRKLCLLGCKDDREREHEQQLPPPS